MTLIKYIEENALNNFFVEISLSNNLPTPYGLTGTLIELCNFRQNNDNATKFCKNCDERCDYKLQSKNTHGSWEQDELCKYVKLCTARQ